MELSVENVANRAGLEPIGPHDKKQLTDSINRQKRSNRPFRRFEIHGGYAGYEFVSIQRAKMTPTVSPTRRASLYLRMSTVAKSRPGEVIAFEQDPAVQERPLRELIAQRG